MINHVLSKFNDDEMKNLDEILNYAKIATLELVKNDLTSVRNKFTTKEIIK